MTSDVVVPQLWQGKRNEGWGTWWSGMRGGWVLPGLEGCRERQPWPKVGGMSCLSCFGVNFSRLLLWGLFLLLRGSGILGRGAQAVRTLGGERTEGKDWSICVLVLWVQAVCCPWSRDPHQCRQSLLPCKYCCEVKCSEDLQGAYQEITLSLLKRFFSSWTKTTQPG